MVAAVQLSIPAAKTPLSKNGTARHERTSGTNGTAALSINGRSDGTIVVAIAVVDVVTVADVNVDGEKGINDVPTEFYGGT